MQCTWNSSSLCVNVEGIMICSCNYTFFSEFSLALYGEMMASKRKQFSLVEKAEIIKKAKDYNGSNAGFTNVIGILYSTLQTISKEVFWSKIQKSWQTWLKKNHI